MPRITFIQTGTLNIFIGEKRDWTNFRITSCAPRCTTLRNSGARHLFGLLVGFGLIDDREQFHFENQGGIRADNTALAFFPVR